MTRCFNNESLYHSCLKRPAGGCVWLGSHNLQEGPLATAHWGTMGSSRQLELEITPDWTRDLASHCKTRKLIIMIDIFGCESRPISRNDVS